MLGRKRKEERGRVGGAILNCVVREGHAVMNKGLKALDEEHPR